MQDDLKEIQSNIAGLPDEELLRVVTDDQEGYRREALDFATEELRRRKICVPPPVAKDLERSASIVPAPIHLTHALPHIWPGYIFALAFLVAETVEVLRDPEASNRVTLLPVLIAVGGWVYWIWCMRGIQMVIHEATGVPKLSSSTGVRTFFMLHGLTWALKWPGDVVDFVNSRLSPNNIDKRWPALGLLGGVLLSRFDAAIGLAIVFGTGTYLRRKLVAALGIG
jgi:hypothetical protein